MTEVARFIRGVSSFATINRPFCQMSAPLWFAIRPPLIGSFPPSCTQRLGINDSNGERRSGCLLVCSPGCSRRPPNPLPRDLATERHRHFPQRHHHHQARGGRGAATRRGSSTRRRRALLRVCLPACRSACHPSVSALKSATGSLSLSLGRRQFLPSAGWLHARRVTPPVDRQSVQCVLSHPATVSLILQAEGRREREERTGYPPS